MRNARICRTFSRSLPDSYPSSSNLRIAYACIRSPKIRVDHPQGFFEKTLALPRDSNPCFHRERADTGERWRTFACDGELCIKATITLHHHLGEVRDVPFLQAV